MSHPLKTGPLASRNRTRTAPDYTMKAILLKFIEPLLNSKLRPYLVSYRTTILGVGIIAASLAEGLRLLAAYSDNGEIDAEAINKISVQFMAGVGLVMAKDGKTTSEQAGLIARESAK